MTTGRKVAVVTGAARGLGLEISRQLARDHGFRVVMADHDPGQGERTLRSEGLDVAFRSVDITQDASVDALSAWLAEDAEQVDVLVNNAGILLERIYGEDENVETDALDVDIDTVRRILDTNLLGALRVIQRLVPLMKAGGRIVNMSSQMGQFGLAGSNMIGYRLSKTGLNALTANLAARLQTEGIVINSCCPGWVRTDLGSKLAPLDVETGARTPVWLAAVAPAELTGKFFHEQREIPW